MYIEFGKVNMIIGIVGSEEAKFTEVGKKNVYYYLEQLINNFLVTKVISGGCHLGGIDIWAIEEALKYGKETEVCYPAGLYWTEYKKRNIEIAQKSDIVYCITVDTLPIDYKGMRFDECYHCEKYSLIPYPSHVKSGGCWTMWYALNHGKKGKLIVVNN